MCLATVYKESDDSVIFKNVSRIDVDGNKLVLRDIMGDERVVEGRILMVDLANSIVKLNSKVPILFSPRTGKIRVNSHSRATAMNSSSIPIVCLWKNGQRFV